MTPKDIVLQYVERPETHRGKNWFPYQVSLNSLLLFETKKKVLSHITGYLGNDSNVWRAESKRTQIKIRFAQKSHALWFIWSIDFKDLSSSRIVILDDYTDINSFYPHLTVPFTIKYNFQCLDSRPIWKQHIEKSDIYTTVELLERLERIPDGND